MVINTVRLVGPLTIISIANLTVTNTADHADQLTDRTDSTCKGLMVGGQVNEGLCVSMCVCACKLNYCSTQEIYLLFFHYFMVLLW